MFQGQAALVEFTVGEMVHPVTEVDIGLAVLPKFDRTVRVSENHSVVSFGEAVPGEGQIIGIVILDEVVLTAHAGKEGGQAESSIRVEESVEADVHRIPERSFQEPVSLVFFGKTVAVGDVDPLSGILENRKILMDGDPEILGEKRAEPEIVIARDGLNPNTDVDEFFQAAENVEMPAGDGGPVFEPEIEKIADNDQTPAFPSDTFEETEQFGLPPNGFRIVRVAKMGV
jgi:hypothetical protein